MTLVTFGRLPDAQQRSEAERIPNLSLVATEYRLEWMDNARDDVLASGMYLLAIARKIKPDLVHANTYYHATLPFRTPVLLTAHSCVSSWWRACKGTPLPQEWTQYENWIHEATRKADLLVAPTRTYLAEFQALHGYGRDARAIRNGSSALPRQGTNKDPFVLAAGRLWDEAKNIDVLVRAVQGTDICIRVAGDARSPDGRGVPLGNLQVLGRLAPEELAQEMARARVFASAARYEPFGLSILEAARAGCALVLSDIPSLRELWDGAATFVDPNDAAGWRQALSMLLSDPILAEARGYNARERSLSYSGERMTRAYCDAYAQIASHRAPEGVAA